MTDFKFSFVYLLKTIHTRASVVYFHGNMHVEELILFNLNSSIEQCDMKVYLYKYLLHCTYFTLDNA